jgi:hypothetical protein
MPRSFNKELLDTHLEKDGAKLVGDYPVLKQNIPIKFTCSCTKEITKKFLSGVEYGFRCSDCQKVLQKAKNKTKVYEPSKSYSLDVLNECLKRDKATPEGQLPQLKKEAIINFRCNCGELCSKTFVSIKQYMLCKKCVTKTKREKTVKTNLAKYGTVCPLQNKTIKEKADTSCLERYGTANVFSSNIIKQKIAKTNLEKYGA